MPNFGVPDAREEGTPQPRCRGHAAISDELMGHLISIEKVKNIVITTLTLNSILQAER